MLFKETLPFVHYCQFTQFIHPTIFSSLFFIFNYSLSAYLPVHVQLIMDDEKHTSKYAEWSQVKTRTTILK